MTSEALQVLCESGQELLMQTEYLRAEAALAEAERQAWELHDWDALSRLYMPLQETRRQRRQRCGEGTIRLDLIAKGPEDAMKPAEILGSYPHGQLLVAGWGTIEPAIQLREQAARVGLYVETFLAAVYPITAGGSDVTGRAVAIVPLPDVRLPPPTPQSIDSLLSRLPAQCIVLNEMELPRGSRRGDTKTFAETMAIWERLHTPFFAAADMRVDPVQRIDAYRQVLRVDYACELAHQKLSDTARQLLVHAQTA
jgi:hypothetical protein